MLMDLSIPTHRLPSNTRFPTRIERIVPVQDVVNNGVHRHDFHELFFFRNGAGEHMIDLEEHVVAVPCMHLVAPGQVHHLVRSADMEGIVVMFGSDARLGQGHGARAELFAMADAPRTVQLDQAELSEALALLTLMEQELARPGSPLDEVVEGYLGILLIKCAHWVRSTREKADRSLDAVGPVRRFLELLEREHLTQRQVSWYAENLALSADHLNELVRDRLGRTVSKVIQDRTLLEAKRLLLHGSMSIKEVGYALNMNDPAYFTRWFSKMEGRTPAAYRNHIREMYKH